MGKTREPIVAWLLGIITFGIYHLVWWYKVNREVRDFDRSIEVSPGIAVVAITIGGMLVVPPFVSLYRTGARIAAAQRAAGLNPDCSGGLGILLAILFGLHTVYYQAKLNEVWRRFGSPPEGTAV